MRYIWLFPQNWRPRDILQVNEEHELCIHNVYNNVEKSAEVDVRLFWKLTKRKKPRSLRIHPDDRDKKGVIYTNPCGVA